MKRTDTRPVVITNGLLPLLPALLLALWLLAGCAGALSARQAGLARSHLLL